MNTKAIAVANLHKSFSLGFGVRKRLGLNGMSFAVEQGSIYGFLGPNGAGKTTSIKVLTSLLRQDSGEAQIFGLEPSSPTARRRLGFLPESPVFYEHLTGFEFLSFCGSLCGMKGKALKNRVDGLMERVGLGHARDLHIRRYSKGMTQRVGIAQAILHDPDLVILDEPMSGLDPMGRTDVRDIILELHKQGKTVFFSTHIIPDVEAICTKVGIVAQGRMIREGTVSELMKEAESGKAEVLAEKLSPTFQSRVGGERASLSGRRLFEVALGEEVDVLLKQILEAGGRVVSVVPKQGSLEELVVKMLSESKVEA